MVMSRRRETQGFADFSGACIYRLTFEIGDEADWLLELSGANTVVAARLDDAQNDRRGWRPIGLPWGSWFLASIRWNCMSPTQPQIAITTTLPILATVSARAD
jgi:hypothetical protein